MKQKITLEEQKKIQLEMLVEIDEFCRAHNIRYMLAFGTLLGAIRHKGYIPWDDDIDISMPLEDMIRFKKEFKSEKLKYCDVDTEKGYSWEFSRIAYNPTYMMQGKTFKQYGVHIDLYPTIEVNSSMDYNNRIIDKLIRLNNRCNWFRWFRMGIIRRLPIATVPGFKYTIRRYRNKLIKLFSYSGGGTYHCIAGPLAAFELHTFPFNPFEDMIEVDFEGYKFMAPAKYHEYLSRRYGDYMQLPPEEQRHPYHGGEFYYND